MNRHRDNTIAQLERLGINTADVRALLRASATLHAWHEHECNGAIQRDEKTGTPYWHNTDTGEMLFRTSDRETGAIKRATHIANCYGLTAYVQTDPRGCALYLLRPGDVPEGCDADAYYSRGVAVVT